MAYMAAGWRPASLAFTQPVSFSSAWGLVRKMSSSSRMLKASISREDSDLPPMNASRRSSRPFRQCVGLPLPEAGRAFPLPPVPGCFSPGRFPPWRGPDGPDPGFSRIGLVVHDGGEDFYGLVQVPLFVGQFAFHEFGIRAHGQVPGRAVVHSRLELFKNGGGLRIAPQVHQNVRQKDVRGPGDGGGFRLPQPGEGVQ